MMAEVRCGSKAALTAPKTDFRFTPESGLNSRAKSEKCHVWLGRGPADCHSGNCPTETVDPPGDVLWSAHGDQINEVGNARCRTEFSPQARRSSRMPRRSALPRAIRRGSAPLGP